MESKGSQRGGFEGSRVFKGSKRSAFGVLPSMIRTVKGLKREACGVLPSVIRTC